MTDSILIVDDERGIRETLRGVLEDEGFAADAVGSGEDALRAVERRPYGCVLLDVWLPGIDGLETLRRLREQGDRKSTRLNSSHANISYAVFCLKKIKSIKVSRFSSSQFYVILPPMPSFKSQVLRAPVRTSFTPMHSMQSSSLHLPRLLSLHSHS